MKKNYKRIVSATLVICLFIGLLLMQTAYATSSNRVRDALNNVLTDFPDGSYFTTDGNRNSPGNLMAVFEARGMDSTGYDESWTCIAFAKYVWAKVFGHSITVKRQEINNGRAGISATWVNAQIGDLVYFYKNSDLKVHPEKNDGYVYDPNVHAAIIWDLSSSGVTLLDCNYGGPNQIKLYTCSFGGSEWPKSYCRVYHATNYDEINGTTGASDKEQRPAVSTLQITPNSYPTGTLNQGSTFPLSGTVTSNYMITSFKGEIINSSGSIVDTASQTASTKALSIRRSKVDMGLEFDKLAGGTYYLRYTATDSSGKTATWKSSAFTVNGASSKTCTVTFDANGGSVSQTSKTVAAGNLIGDLPMPTRTGYTFLGWSTVKTGSMMLVTADNFYVQQDETLYAIWRKEASRVTRTTQLDVRNMETTSNSAEGWSWNKETKTLTLDNVNFAVSDQPSALITGSATIILNGENTIKSTYNNSKDTYNTTGIYAINGHLVFEGDGSLTASGGTSGGSSIGIAAGLAGTGSVTINSGSVTAIGGTSTGFDSYGIRTHDLTINGGSFTAIGGTAPSSSHGVYIYSGTLNVNGGIFKASSGATQNSRSLPGAAAGVYAGQGGSINIGSSVTIVEPANYDIVEIDSRNRATSILNMSGEPAKEVIIQEMGK